MTRAWSIRWKLTAWYIVALSIILLIFGGLMYAMMLRQLHERIDIELMEEAKELTEEVCSLQSIEEIRLMFDKRYVQHGGYSFQISRVDGTVICGSPWLRAHVLPGPNSVNAVATKSLQDISLANLGLHRLLCRTVQGSTVPLMIHVLEPYSQSHREFREFIRILVVAGFVALAVACAGGLLIARRALDPLERIIRVAERISTENLTTLIAVENPRDELGRLAATLNDTFGRLRDSVERIQRFTADAAHELRTPLSVLRTRLEVAIRLPIDAEQFRKSYQIAIEQTDRLTTLIDQLLMLSRQDAGVSKSLFDEVYIKPLLEDVVEVLRETAVEKGVSLTAGEIPNCVVSGDDISLSRVFFNLIDNAIKYTSAGGRVQLAGFCGNQQVRLLVCDTGIGIESEHLPKLFDRFYRIDPSRNGQTGGTGLGLAICRSIVKSHQGEISVSSLSGSGTTFTVTLPLIAESVTEVTFMEEYDVQSNRTSAGRIP